MIPRIGQLCLKFRVPRFTSRRQMSEGKMTEGKMTDGKGKGQAMKFDIGSGDKKRSYEFVDEQAGGISCEWIRDNKKIGVLSRK